MMSRTNASGTRPNASGTRARPNASMRPPLNKGDALRDASADTTSMLLTGRHQRLHGSGLSWKPTIAAAPR